MTERAKLDRTMAIVSTKVQIAEARRQGILADIDQLIEQVRNMLAKGEQVADDTLLVLNQKTALLVAVNAEANTLRAVIERGLQ
jgi:hypothetical protein